jgi:hypothetical protein
MKKILLLLFSFVSGEFLSAQPTAENIRQSLWQQQVNYNIRATLNDQTHTISAFVEMEYINNSPDALTEIYIHLWPNAYKDNSTAFARHELEGGSTDFYFAKPEERGYIDSLTFKVDGNVVSWNYLKDTIDICRIQLAKPLQPGGRITVSTPFKVKFPKVFSRMGHKDHFYAATQWYPKPAVYDVSGWNHMPYLNQGEFYSEFGNFTVTLTVPAHYRVAASGELQTPAEQEWINQLNGSSASARADSGSAKTIVYQLDKAHDFAWFAADKGYFAQSKVTLKSGKEVHLQTFSVTESPKQGLEFLANAVTYYSLEVGEYPYSVCTAVDGPLEAGGGMEYPTITICNGLNETVVLHEVGHNWFYGILGSNERKYPWMDEGLNSFYENSYFAHRPMIKVFQGKRDPFDLNRYTIKDQSHFAYLLTARRNEDQKINEQASAYSLLNYGAIVYMKSYLVFDHLRSYLGKPLFDSCMKTYYETWKFKHPLPGDFRNIFEQVSGKNLDWFFDTYLNTTQRNDYEIISCKKRNGNYTIKIRNNTGLVVPLSFSTVKNGEITLTQWHPGFKQKQTFTLPDNGADRVVIDAIRTTPDYNRSNNSIKTSGLFKKSKPVKLQLLGSLENPERQQIFYSPLVGWNEHNRWMLGMAFYNSLLPQKTFQYTIAPMYSSTSNDLNGYINLKKIWSTTTVIKNIDVGYDAARFRTTTFGQQSAFYQKQAPYVTFHLRSGARSKVNRFVRLRGVFVYEEEDSEGMDYDVSYYTSRFLQAQYAFANNKALNPWGFRMQLEKGKDYYVRFDKITAEWKSRYNLGMKKKHFDVRVFAGKMFTQKLNKLSGLEGRYFLRLSDNTGYIDYTYDQTLMGRGASNGIFAQQILPREGGFKTLAGIGSTNDWLVAANLRCDIPGLLPIKLFADFGTYANAKSAFPGSQALVYNAGVILKVKENIFEVYFPVVASNDIKQYWELNKVKYAQRITFLFNLNSLNPLDIVKGIGF